MVRTERVGKPRPFLRGLALTIVTFGIYGVYWKYKAPQELYRQFDLLHEGRDEGVAWLVLGLVLPVVMLVYYWKAAEHVRYIRRRLGLEPGLSPRGLVGFHVASKAILFAGVLGALASPVLVQTRSPAVVFGGVAAVFLLSYGLLAEGYRRFQRDINEVWAAWEDRKEELTDGGPWEPDPPAPEGQGPAPGPTA